MENFNSKKKLFTGLMILFLLASFFYGSVYAQVENPDKLILTTLENQSLTKNQFPIRDLGTDAVQAVRLDSTLLTQVQKQLNKNEPSLLTMQIFPELTIDALITDFSQPSSITTLYTGIIKEDSNSSVFLVETDGLINAKITYFSKQYQLQNINGEYFFSEIDQTQFPGELDPIPVVPSPFESIYSQPDPTYDGNPTIDIMVVYTELARNNAGGTEAMENLINIAIAETNTGYANSGISQQMRLVHTAEVNYNEINFNWSNALNQLKNTSDGVIDQVHTDRDTYGADLVVMIVNNTAYCGLGYLMQVPDSVYAAYGFSIVSRVCATGYYSLAHETGHNMGAAHDRANASVAGVYDYSYGYQAPDQSFRTIMAYNCPSGCPRLNYWSNASVSYAGQPMGVFYTEPLAAENFRTLNNTAAVIAAFRTSTFVSGPSDLRTTEIKSGSITMQFTDNSDNETGFLVERSEDGVNWSALLTLSPNQTIFSDTSLACSADYYYRVKSFKNTVYSEPSNTLQVTTTTCAPPQSVSLQSLQILFDSVFIELNNMEENATYYLQTSPDGTNGWQNIQILENGISEYLLDGLISNTSYYFRVESKNDYGTSYSNILTVKTGIPLFIPLITR